MKAKSLILLEIEESWLFPTFEVVTVIAMYFLLTVQPPFSISPQTSVLMNPQANAVNSYTMFLSMIIVGVMYSRSVASSLEKREILTLFSRPVNRSSILACKVITNSLTIFLIPAALVLIRTLLARSPFDGAVLAQFLALSVLILFLTSIALASAVFTRSAWATTISTVIVPLMMAFTLTDNSLKSFSPLNGLSTIYEYLTFPPLHRPPTTEFMIALGFPISIASILILLSFVRFSRMQVD